MNLNFSKIAASLAVGLLLPIAAHAATQVCGYNSGTESFTLAASNGTGCNELITISATGVVSVAVETTTPYDGADDQVVGVVNFDASPLSSLTLDASSTGTDIFGFDGDGISTYVSAATDSSGYGGPDNTFSGINGAATIGTVNFTTALVQNTATGTNPYTTGSYTYFSLEEAPPATGGAGFVGTVGGAIPEPNSLMLMGTGVLGMAGMLRRRIVNAIR